MRAPQATGQLGVVRWFNTINFSNTGLPSNSLLKNILRNSLIFPMELRVLVPLHQKVYPLTRQSIEENFYCQNGETSPQLYIGPMFFHLVFDDRPVQ